MSDLPKELAHCTGFQWDDGNTIKNWDTHQVSPPEAEQMFFNRPILVAPDLKHSAQEPRYAALGQSDAGRQLTAIFTVRGTLIRVISVRDMSRAERRIYGQSQAD
jgi:uncharacterized protein